MEQLHQNVTTAIQHLGGQNAAARALGVSQPAVYKWAHGRAPTRAHVRQIAELLEVHPVVIEFGDLAAALEGQRQPETPEEVIERDRPTPRRELGEWRQIGEYRLVRPWIYTEYDNQTLGASVSIERDGPDDDDPYSWLACHSDRHVIREGAAETIEAAQREALAALIDIVGYDPDRPS